MSDPREATGPARHILKTHPPQFEALQKGEKTFEWRKDDRGFEVGDMLVLQEWAPQTDHPDGGYYTEAELIRWVTYIVRGPAFGIPEGYCVMSVSETSPGSGASEDAREKRIGALETALRIALALYTDVDAESPAGYEKYRQACAVLDGGAPILPEQVALSPTEAISSAREEGRRALAEEVAKIVELAAERQEAWDWRHLPAIVRSLASPSTPPTDMGRKEKP